MGDHVVVVGGGVAGMAAALELSACDCTVTLLEATSQLGGKFGGTESDGVVHEHGYHFFADYCVNFIDLMDQLGLSDTLEAREAIKFLRRGDFPNMRELRNNSSERFFWHNAYNGPVDWPHFVLYVYSILDLALEDFQETDFLDLISVNGYLASKPYMTVDAALLHQQSLLKTLSLASYRTSVSSYQRWMRYTLAYREPMMRVLNRNCMDGFIRPLEQHLQSRGVRIFRNAKVDRIEINERGGEINLARELDLGGQATSTISYDALVLALPIECVSKLIDDEFYSATSRFRRDRLGEPPPLASVRELKTAPMASLDIQFRHKIRDMPKEHITFLQSEFDLSCIDLSQLWNTGDATYVNAVATDIQRLTGLSGDYPQELILDEVLLFLGQSRADVESIHYRSNVDSPLFLNEVGSWHDRPEVVTAVPSIVLAGDYIRNSFGIASVEGAIMSAKQAVINLARYLNMEAAPRMLYPMEVPNEEIEKRRRILEPFKARALGALWAQGKDGQKRSALFE